VRILISGICGFAGSTIARGLALLGHGHEISGFDNFTRAGSETNRAGLKELGIKVYHGDVRVQSDVDALPSCDWLIDCSANSSVLAGVDGRTTSRQTVESNLGGTVNLLEYCKSRRAGFILLSSSRVYSIAPLSALRVRVVDHAFAVENEGQPAGVSARGVSEAFATSAPVSLYGATKLASEALALEYGHAFGLPVFINRCGVLAGAGQFGRPDQGIFSYWINSHLRRRQLKYIGFDGTGHQVRDCLHPSDLISLLKAQLGAPKMENDDRIANFGGGAASALSLHQLNAWCDERFGAHAVATDVAPRAFDVPWMVLDCSKAARIWGWKPKIERDAILEEIAAHAGAHPDWLEVSAPLG
jgi:CDP-paratose 2-epimerase